MLSLAEAQAAFVRTLNEGPDALADGLFAGPVDRVMLGLKAHANTISHARLVALEETFPLTRKHLGDEEFNLLTREFSETAHARASDSNLIGLHFPDFLRAREAGPGAVDLARIEWAWLESYHSAEAEPLLLDDIGGLNEIDLTALPVRWHLATRLIELEGSPSFQLTDLPWPVGKADAILVTRPEADVRLLPLETRAAKIAKAAKSPTSLGNLLALSSELGDEGEAHEPVLTLIGAGALVAMA